MPPSRRPGSAGDSSSHSQFPPSDHSTGSPPSHRSTASSTASSVGRATPSQQTSTSSADSAGEVSLTHRRSSASRARPSSFSQFTPCEGSSPTYHYNFIYRSEDSPIPACESTTSKSSCGSAASETSCRARMNDTSYTNSNSVEYRSERPIRPGGSGKTPSKALMHPAVNGKASITNTEDGRHLCPLLEVQEIIRYNADEANITIRSVRDIPEVLQWWIAIGSTHANEILQSGPDSWFSLAGYSGSCSCGRWGFPVWGDMDGGLESNSMEQLPDGHEGILD